MKLKYECDFLGVIFFTKFCENELMILQTFDKLKSKIIIKIV